MTGGKRRKREGTPREILEERRKNCRGKVIGQVRDAKT